jgi:AcrR family transcriptional regulator
MGRAPRIDRASVLVASLELADERGLSSVTMHAVADRLGVTPMALYRHVASKADLLDGMVEQLLLEVAVPDPALPAAARFTAFARGVRETARRHPDVFVLLLQRPATTPAARRVRDAVYDALRAGGLVEEDVARMERVLSTVVLGFAASEVGGRFAGHDRQELDEDFAFMEALLLRGLAGYVGTPAAEGFAASPAGRRRPPSAAPLSERPPAPA